MKKNSRLFPWINGLVCIILAACTVRNSIQNISWLQYSEKMQIKSLLLVTVLLCISGGLLSLCIRKNAKTFYVYFALVTCCIQLILIHQLVSEVGWDSGAVIAAALHSVSEETSIQYLSVYPNNLFLVFLYQLLFRLFGIQSIIDAYYVAALFNMLCIQITMFFLYRCLDMLFQRVSVWMGMLCYTFLFVLSPWVIIPYSDIVSMPFNCYLFYCFLKMGNTTAQGTPAGKKIFTDAFRIAAVTFIGTCIKPTVLIISIAGFIYLWITDAKKKQKYIYKICMLTSIVIFLLLGGIWNQALKLQTDYPLDANKKMTYSHYLMLGLNNNRGVYTQEDYEISQNQPDVKSRQAANRKEIIARLEEKGVTGYFTHIWDKTCMIHSEGVFFWGGESGMNFLNFDLSRHSLLRNIYYINGTHYFIYKYAAQGIWFFMLLVAGIGVFSVRHNNTTERVMISLIILGIIAFNMLFEARSRYLIPFLPFYTMVFCYGVETISWFLRQKQK